MTKIPTKKILKLGYTATTYKGMGISTVFEYKVLPFLSLEAGIYSRTAREGDGISFSLIDRQLNGQNLFASGGARWYPNMRKRIARQQSANNFTGSYLSISYESSLAAIQNGKVRDHFSMSYGFQGRFLNNGFLDFSLGLYYLRPFPEWFTSGMQVPTAFRIDNLVFASRSLIGLAFGDWKKNDRGPLCDVLYCDYLVRKHFKVRLPEVNIGIRGQFIRGEIGYERKLGPSPLSLNFSLWNETRTSLGRYSGIQATTMGEAQLRFYYLQKKQISKGRASDNLSGLYLGSRLAYIWRYRDASFLNPVTNAYSSAGIMTGYQQRLFNRLYFDALIGFSGLSSDKKLIKVESGEFNAKASVGFAF
ncbi:hypothetical protein [Dyadobacter sediminis]|uniref:Uncharacterized protein n=1 Tax=Dyadobacter sediminis TaxID=1493691 RepID=A0A5R9KIX5_9BACT|nr:hypothetical protein [Dyadobacter sediminis]TLU96046.1 hypothetical protein FEM55_02545 [Dyadobacter sediminis]